MDGDKMLESYIKLAKYINKINAESIVKSIMFGATFGFVVSFIYSFAAWLADIPYWWISIIIFAAVTIAVTTIAYFNKFKPDLKDVARRLDKLGLEERVVTMLELTGSSTIMAAHQLNSTIAALGGVTTKMLPVMVSAVMCVALGISGAFGASMVTVHALSANGRGPTASDVIDAIDPEPEVFYTIRYEVVYVDGNYNQTDEYSGIEIDGNDEQIVLEGTDAEPVLVYVEDDPDDEQYIWDFLGWYDVLDFTEEATSLDPYRQDLAVTLDNAGSNVVIEDDETIITHYAIFKLEKGEGGDGDGEGEGEEGDESEEGDTPPDEPQEGDNNDDGDGEDDSQSPGGNGAGGGKYDAGNQIINGSEYYRDHYDEYMAEYLKYLENGGEIPEYLRKFIETYYDIIK